MNPRLNKLPSGYYITVNGEVLEEAGVHGVISKRVVADRLVDSLRAQYPEKSVDLFACFKFNQESLLT